MNEIKCIICNKKIKDEDDVILGSKDDYNKLPSDIKTTDIIFMHSGCFKKHNEDNNETKD